MPQQDKIAYRQVGGAHKRYGDLHPDADREAIYRELLKTPRAYARAARLNGSSWLQIQADKLVRRAFRYRYCCYEYLLLKCGGCGTPFIGPLRCESRICSYCGRKHFARSRERLLDRLDSIKTTKSKRLMFLTLTLQSEGLGLNAKQRAAFLFSCARKLINRLYPKSKGSGAFAVLEVGKSFNLHIHALVYGGFVEQRAISKLWLEITGNSYIVDIRWVRSAKRQVSYLLKYMGKPTALTEPEDIALYLEMITGLRRIHTYGVFYGTRLFNGEGCPCPLCGGKLLFQTTDGGLRVPLGALFFSEAVEITKAA